MNLKIGGSNMGKIMYGGQEFGGGHKSGDIIYAAQVAYSRDEPTEFGKLKMSEGEKYKVSFYNKILDEITDAIADTSNISSLKVGSDTIGFTKNGDVFEYTTRPAGIIFIQIV